MKKFRLVIFFFLIGSLSCQLFKKENEEDALARVHTKYLYKDDIGDLLIKLSGDKDSATIISNYINNWVQQELLLQKADLNLSDEQKDFTKLLEDYRKSLIIYAFQKEWIREKLDTSVSEAEISAHYNANPDNFELKENIVKMRFVKVAKNAPKLELIEKLIQKEDEESRAELKDYCIQYSLNYNDNDSMWFPFDEVKQKLPLDFESEEDFLKNNQFVIKADSLNYYLLFINEYKIKNSISPLSFEREKIRNIIINQRKLSLISKMKSDLFKSELDKGNAEIFQH